MKKEKYISPSAEVMEIDEADVITTSPIATGDELKGITSDYLDPNDPLYELF